MTISATYIGQSTIQVSTSYSQAQGSGSITPFMTFANVIADAITGTQPAANGSFSGLTFSSAVGVTAQTTANSTPTPSTNSGWTLYDAFWGGVDGTAGTSSPVYTQVYRSGNKDGTTAKNIVLRYNIKEQVINTTTYQYWDTQTNYDAGTISTASPTATTTATASSGSNSLTVASATGIVVGQIVVAVGVPSLSTVTAISGTTVTISQNTTASLSTTAITFTTTTHTGTAEAWTYFDSAPISYNLSACDFIISVCPRWCILHSYLNNESTMWAGVVETAREDIMDTVANKNPCWGWISSTLWSLGAVTANLKPLSTGASGDYTLICMPRTKNGSTGVSAAKGWGADFGVTAHPTWLFPATPGAAFTYYLGTGGKFLANGWDASRRLTLPIKPIADFSTATVTNYGQIYGMKLLAPVGQNMNKINIAVDSDGNASATSSDRGHWLLNCHHKTADTTSWLTSANATITNTVFATALKPGGMISTGSGYYYFSYDGTRIARIDATTQVETAITTAQSGYCDIKYDGERYIYVTSTTATIALTKIDIATDTVVSTVNVTGGFIALSLSGDTICAAQYNAGTAVIQPIFNRYIKQGPVGAPAALTATSTNATVTTVATVGEAVIIRDIICDFDGNFWAAGIFATNTNFKLIKISPAGVSSLPTWTTTGGQIYPAAATGAVGLQIVDGNNLVIYHAVTVGGALYQVQVNPRTSVVISNTTVSSISASTAGTSISYAKIQGNLFVYPKNSAAANVSAITPLGRTITSALPAPIINLDIGTTYFAALNSFIFWDGARLIGSTDGPGLRVFSNFNGGINNGGNPTSAYSFGQVAIPV